MSAGHSSVLSPAGRIGRRRYWTLTVSMIVVSGMLTAISFVGPLLATAMLWPLACIVTKRLHDSGCRAWIVVAVMLLKVAALLLSFTATVMATSPGFVIAAFELAAATLWLDDLSNIALLALLLLAGLAPECTGDNRCGTGV